MSAAHHVIRHASELGDLSVMPLQQPRGRIRLDLPGLPEPDRRNWEKRLNRACRSGGSGETLAGFLIGFLVGLAVFAQAFADGHLGWVGGAAVLGLIVLPSLVGKAIGLFKAQAHLQRLVADFQAQWPAEPHPANETEASAVA